jgi:hypothetical protein
VRNALHQLSSFASSPPRWSSWEVLALMYLGNAEMGLQNFDEATLASMGGAGQRLYVS